MMIWPFNAFEFIPGFHYPTEVPQPSEGAVPPAETPVEATPPAVPEKRVAELILEDLRRIPAIEWNIEPSTRYKTYSHPQVPYSLFTKPYDQEDHYTSILGINTEVFTDKEELEIWRSLREIQEDQYRANEECQKVKDAEKLKEFFPKANIKL